MEPPPRDTKRSGALCLRGSAPSFGHAAMNREGAPPNKRLKLAGDDRSKGSGVLCPSGHELSFNYTVARRASRRSLSAIPLDGANDRSACIESVRAITTRQPYA